MSDDLESTLSRMREAMFFNLNMMKLPEYWGKPQESIDEFLKEFKRATIAFTDEQKCQAIKRALVGDAGIFAKKFLKQDLNAGKWKEVKKALLHRFLPVDIELSYRNELNKMSFNKNHSTLLGYVDRYISLYKKIHQSAADKELISDLGINLGKQIIRKLNRFSADWEKMENIDEFRSLIARLDKDLLYLDDEPSEEIKPLTTTINNIVTTALENQIKGLKDMIETSVQKKEEKIEETLAAIRQQYNRRPFEKDRTYNREKRKDRDISPDQESQPRKYNEQRWHRTTNDLKAEYIKRFGQVHGGCYTCGGYHFRKHCPLGNLDNLKH